jgi:hypothetical protein
MAFEAIRARRLLDEGSPLVASLHGHLRYAIAGYVAGGHAALDALAAVDFDIYADTPRPSGQRFAAHLFPLLWDAYRHPPARGRVAAHLDEAPAVPGGTTEAAREDAAG